MQPVIAAITKKDVDPSTFKLAELPDSTDPLKVPLSVGEQLLKWLSDQEPAILGVVPEEPLYIYVVNFDYDINLTFPQGISIKPLITIIEKVKSSDNLNPYEWSVSSQQTQNMDISVTFSFNFIPITLTFNFIEVKIDLPAVDQLQQMNKQSSSNYDRNSLLMGLSLQVINEHAEESKPSLPFPVWLPLPKVQEPDWKGLVTIGVNDIPNPTATSSTNYLGKAAVPDLNPQGQPMGPDASGGQVRWYSLEPKSLSQIEFLSEKNMPSTSSWPDKKLALTPPPSITSKLAQIRRMGRWLVGKDLRDNQPFLQWWNDNGVQFKRPAGEEFGVAIIWRDDLPSRPLVNINFQEYAAQLIHSLWRPARIELETIDVGQTIELGVERLAEAANNALVKFLGNKLLVEFKFEIIKSDPGFFRSELVELNNQSGNAKFLDNYYSDFEPGNQGVSKRPLVLRYIPNFAQKTSATADEVSITIQLRVKLFGTVDLLNQPFTFNGENFVLGEIALFLKQIKLDTLAIFFKEPDFQGPTLLMLPEATTEVFDFLKGARHLDAITQTGPNEKRMQLFSALKTTLGVFQIGQMFLPDSGKSSADMIFKVISFIIDKGASVIDATGSVEFLENCIYAKNVWGDLLGKSFYDSFDNQISSAILIGFPYSRSKTIVKCYQNKNFNNNPGEANGKILELKIPDGCFIAAIRDMGNPALAYKIPFLDDGWVDPPLNMPDGNDRNFNDRINSIKFVTEN